MNRWVVRLCALLFVTMLFGALSDGRAQQGVPSIALFNGKDLSGWERYAQDPKANLDEMFSVDSAETAIVIKGKTMGYLMTKNEYDNYELSLEWRWGDKQAADRPAGQFSGNSGVLLHVNGQNKIWPRSIEAQLQSNQAGDFWLIDGHPLTVDVKRQDPRNKRHYFRFKENVEKPIGQWNRYVITCRGGEVLLKVNDVEMNHGEGANPARGKIAFQAEGAEIHLRNIRVKPIK